MVYIYNIWVEEMLGLIYLYPCIWLYDMQNWTTIREYNLLKLFIIMTTRHDE